jgi:xanthine dehydrogenase accessory factor
VLEELPFEITWVDSREELLPRSLPPHIHVLHAASPAEAAASAPPGVRHLVMTHDHAIDYDVCRALLLREDFRWLGLIGSASKSARFRSRLRKEGVTEAAIARLSCPIGVEGIEGKAPSVIAISVAAQVLQTLSTTVDKSEPVVEHLPHEGVDACTGACSECESARVHHP